VPKRASRAAAEPHAAAAREAAATPTRLDEDQRCADIGITVSAAHQRRGYASEAVSRILEHLLTERGLHKVCAECDARNTASAALLRRAGFEQEGLRRAHTWVKGEWTDDLLFGLLAR
jgi:aminoglycoside 6'-N-acetyltransferase